MKKKTIAATGITLAAVVALAGGYLWSTANNRPQSLNWATTPNLKLSFKVG